MLRIAGVLDGTARSSMFPRLEQRADPLSPTLLEVPSTVAAASRHNAAGLLVRSRLLSWTPCLAASATPQLRSPDTLKAGARWEKK